jgi:hypothetical protein
MSLRRPIPRVRVVAAIFGTLLGTVGAVMGFGELGWYALLLIPLGSVFFLFGRGSLEEMDRASEKEITVHLDLHPEKDDPRGGAA